MAIKLYTLREVAMILDIPRETFRHWTRTNPDSPTWIYTPPEPFAVTGPNRMLLWTEEQLAEMKKALPEIEERRKIMRAKCSLPARTASRKNREERQKLKAPKPVPMKKLKLTYVPLMDDAKAYVEEFHKEREELALQILLSEKK
jgi:hypothetical protein